MIVNYLSVVFRAWVFIPVREFHRSLADFYPTTGALNNENNQANPLSHSGRKVGEERKTPIYPVPSPCAVPTHPVFVLCP